MEPVLGHSYCGDSSHGGSAVPQPERQSATSLTAPRGRAAASLLHLGKRKNGLPWHLWLHKCTLPSFPGGLPVIYLASLTGWLTGEGVFLWRQSPPNHGER